MAFGTWFVNISNALIYFVCTFEIHGKIWEKNLIATTTNIVATYMQITILT